MKISLILAHPDNNSFNHAIAKVVGEEFESYEQWVEFIGGKRNIFLRELIKDKKLA